MEDLTKRLPSFTLRLVVFGRSHFSRLRPFYRVHNHLYSIVRGGILEGLSTSVLRIHRRKCCSRCFGSGFVRSDAKDGQASGRRYRWQFRNVG
jgi:hypothetical protein